MLAYHANCSASRFGRFQDHLCLVSWASHFQPLLLSQEKLSRAPSTRAAVGLRMEAATLIGFAALCIRSLPSRTFCTGFCYNILHRIRNDKARAISASSALSKTPRLGRNMLSLKRRVNVQIFRTEKVMIDTLPIYH